MFVLQVIDLFFVDGTASVIIANHTLYDSVLCLIILHHVHSDDLYFNKWFIM